MIAGFCRRLDIAGIVDRACPVRDIAYATHGQVIEALIANRLTSPAPLVHVEDWARAWAVEEVFALSPEVLNDDRIGRALDAVAPELAGIVGSIGATAIAGFGIDVARIHWDMTSISLFGAYKTPDSDYIEPRFGHPKDRRPDLLQVQTGLAVTADGGIPVWHRAYHGGAGEVAQVVPAMQALSALAGERRFLMIGDSKLVSYKNLAAIIDAKVSFIAPASKTYVGAAVLAACDFNTADPVDYIAQRDTNKTEQDRGSYRVSEDTMILTGTAKSEPDLRVRRVFVWSSARAGAAVNARAKKLDRARGDLERLGRGLGGRYYPTTTQVTERVAVIARERRVKSLLTTTIGTDPTTTKPTLEWHFDQTALAAEASTDGWYALLTNLDPDINAADVLRDYKGQETVERRYGFDSRGQNFQYVRQLLTEVRRLRSYISEHSVGGLEHARRLANERDHAVIGPGRARIEQRLDADVLVVARIVDLVKLMAPAELGADRVPQQLHDLDALAIADIVRAAHIFGEILVDRRIVEILHR